MPSLAFGLLLLAVAGFVPNSALYPLQSHLSCSTYRSVPFCMQLCLAWHGCALSMAWIISKASNPHKNYESDGLYGETLTPVDAVSYTSSTQIVWITVVTSLCNEIQDVYCPNQRLKNYDDHTSAFNRLLILAKCSFDYFFHLKKALEDGESMLIASSLFHINSLMF